MRARTFVATGWLNIAAQVGLLGALWAFGRQATLEGPALRREFALLGLVGAPSIIWALFFYVQDLGKREPSRYVVAAFLAGMAAAAVFALPIERDIFQTSAWLYRSTATLALGSTLVRGALMCFLVYLVIRHGFLPSREFDEPVDGMVYGAFVGSGFATIASLTYLIGHPDLTLFATAYTAATQVLMYSSVGSLVGYFVGRTRFSPRPSQGSHVLGLLAGVALTGLYHTAGELALLSGAPGALWASFGATAALSAVLLGLVTALMRHLHGQPVRDPAGIATGRGALVWTAALLLLAGGGLVMHVETREVTVTSASPHLAFRYPAASLRPLELAPETPAWSPLLSVIFAGRGDMDGPFGVTVGATAGAAAPGAVDPLAYLGSAEPIALAIEPVSVGGRPATSARYAYLDRAGMLGGGLPAIVWVRTDIVPGPGHTVVFALEGRPRGFGRQERLYQRILDSVRWDSVRRPLE